MGGSGSGSWKTLDKKTTVEECGSIDALRWQRVGILQPSVSNYSGRWRWFDPDTKEEYGSIGYQSDCDKTFGSVRLSYTVTREEGKVPLDYRVRLTTTTTPWGKLRWWFICPLVADGRPCGRRVRKLYMPGGGRYFGCRHCYDLTYTSCQESHEYDRLYRDLGAAAGVPARLVAALFKLMKR